MKRAIILAIFLIIGFGLSAQEQDAKTLHETAKTFIRQGDYTNAVIVLTHALQKDPNNLEILKDLAFTYYLQRDYPKAMNTAKPLPDRPDADVQAYQILGMVYKAIENRKDCEKMYKEGLKKFPNSGVLYNEYAEVLYSNDPGDAIKYWEKGIEVDPNYSSNYYNACKYYYSKSEKVWILIYGEIFLNLESYSKRTTEIKDLVEDGYKRLFTSLDDIKKQNAKNPFINAFLNTLNDQSSSIAEGITALSLSVLRTRFILEWDDKNAPTYPFRLFDYHRQLIKEGMFDAYNEWLFGAAQDLQAFEKWTESHRDEYNRFIDFQRGRIFRLPMGQNYASLQSK